MYQVFIKESKSAPRNFIYSVENRISSLVNSEVTFLRTFTPFQIRNNKDNLLLLGNGKIIPIKFDTMNINLSGYLYLEDNKVLFTIEKILNDKFVIAKLVKLCSNTLLLIVKSEHVTVYKIGDSEYIHLLPRHTELVDDFFDIILSENILTAVDNRLFTNADNIAINIQKTLVRYENAKLELQTNLPYDFKDSKLVIYNIPKGSSLIKIKMVMEDLKLERSYNITRINE